MSRPIQFIPDLDSVAHKQFVQMWQEECPIIRMMEHFNASRTTILTHAARAGLPIRNYKHTAIAREESRISQETVLRAPFEPEIVTLRCEACHGQYTADAAEDVFCPYCQYPHAAARRPYVRQQREA